MYRSSYSAAGSNTPVGDRARIDLLVHRLTTNAATSSPNTSAIPPSSPTAATFMHWLLADVDTSTLRVNMCLNVTARLELMITNFHDLFQRNNKSMSDAWSSVSHTLSRRKRYLKLCKINKTSFPINLELSIVMVKRKIISIGTNRKVMSSKILHDTIQQIKTKEMLIVINGQKSCHHNLHFPYTHRFLQL